MEFDEYKDDLYRVWHVRIHRLCWIFTGLVFSVEIAVFILLLRTRAIDIVPGQYILGYVLLPSLINSVASIIATRTLFDRNLPVQRRNWISCILLWVIATVTAVVHNYFSMVLVLPCITIFISAIFADKRLMNTIMLMVLVSTALSMVTWVRDNFEREPMLLAANGIVYVIVVVCSYLMAQLIMKSQQEQIDFIYDAYTRQQELIAEMNIEPMTRLYNKTALDGCMKLYIQKFLNNEFTPHLVLIDIDHFKNVNDVYGHNAGDVVLIRLAELIRNKMKGSRRAFRFGGDEMVLLFGSESLGQIQEIMEELRTEFKSTQYDFRPKEPITLSIGIAAYYKGLSEKAWFELVDSTMYKSKTHGRDSIYTA